MWALLKHLRERWSDCRVSHLEDLPDMSGRLRSLRTLTNLQLSDLFALTAPERLSMPHHQHHHQALHHRGTGPGLLSLLMAPLTGG